MANGVVAVEHEDSSIDMEKLVALIASGTRWKDFQNNPEYAINKSILVSTTDVRKSNSAAVVSGACQLHPQRGGGGQERQRGDPCDSEGDAVLSQSGISGGEFRRAVRGLPGDGDGESAHGDDLRVAVPGASGQDQAPRQLDGAPLPAPYHLHQAYVRGVDTGREKLGALLESDPELQKIAIEYGFRNGNQGYALEFQRRAGVSVPENLIDVIDPPSFEIIEKMIGRIEQQFQ